MAGGDVHGGYSELFGDAEALRSDLCWREANGFTRLDWDCNRPIDPGPWTEPRAGGVHGGVPAMGDAEVFRRVFTLLRHILQEPFNAPLASSDAGPPGGPRDGVLLHRYLIERLVSIEGSHLPTQEAVLRHDLRHLLRPYGFSPRIQGRPDSLRQGYAIGTALLSADQLLEVHSLLDESNRRLLHSRRALAHRSFSEERSGTLADQESSARIERAIQERRRVWLRHRPDAASLEQRERGEDGRFQAWPL